MVVDFKLSEISHAAGILLDSIGNKKVIAFHGEMGAGKTTFIHALCSLLKVHDPVSSPTFSIINEYRTSNGEIIYHMDLYRLKNEEEGINAGVEETLHSGHLCFAEWPDKAPGLFPYDTIFCYLNPLSADERKLKINL